MKTFLYLLFSASLLAQTPATAPASAPEVEQIVTGSIDLGYRWRTSVAGSFDTYRSVVNLGSGPKLLGADFTIVAPKQHLFDRIDVRAADWGDDPYTTLHITAKKARRYDLNLDYRNISYFNNLPSFADPLLARGVVLNEQSFDTKRRITSVALDFLPGNWLIPYLAFDADSDTGSGVNAYVSGANEYPVPTLIRNSVNTYRGGVRLEFRHFHVTLEEGSATYKDDQRNYFSGSTSYGNSQTPLLGQTLDLTHLAQAYGIRGTTTFSKLLLTASPASWLDLYAQGSYSRPDNNVNYQEFASGNLANVSQLLFYTSQQYLLSAEAKLPHTAGSIGAEIRPLRRVRILESWLTDRLSGSPTAVGNLSIFPAALLPAMTTQLGSSLTTNYNRQQLDVIADVLPKLTLHVAYRYVWGDASDALYPIAGLSGFERGRLQQNAAIGGFTYRPTQAISVNAEFEAARSGGSYFRTSLYNYEKLRVRARYRVTPTLQLTADANWLSNQNPTPGIQFDYTAQQESASLLWSPPAAKGWDLQASYTRSAIRSNIAYLVPQTLTPEQDLYVDNDHALTLLFNGHSPKLSGHIANVSAGGAFVLSSGSRPTSYFQPFVKLSSPLTKSVAWVSEWRYYGFAESFTNYENFRTHLITTGLRFTR